LKGATISAAVVLMVFGMKAFDFLYSLSGDTGRRTAPIS